jgi:hypothetical protein
MAPAKPEWIEFGHQDWSAVVARAEVLVAAQRGWLNLSPEITDDEGIAHGGSKPVGLGAVFRTVGPTVPIGTWVVRTAKAPGTVGVEHDLRTKVLPRLTENGITPPAGSFRLQDNPRRGLVLRLPDDVVVEDVLSWLMQAVDDLCPLQLTGNWLAAFHAG